MQSFKSQIEDFAQINQRFRWLDADWINTFLWLYVVNFLFCPTFHLDSTYAVFPLNLFLLLPENVGPASSCSLTPTQPCGEDGSSSSGSSSSGSTRPRSSSWTRDMEPRFPEWQPTVSAARPGDTSAGRENSLQALQHFHQNTSEPQLQPLV